MFGQSPKTLPGTCHLTMKAWISWEEKYLTFDFFFGLSSLSTAVVSVRIQTHTITHTYTSYTRYTNKPTTILRQRTQLRDIRRSPDSEGDGHVTSIVTHLRERQSKLLTHLKQRQKISSDNQHKWKLVMTCLPSV